MLKQILTAAAILGLAGSALAQTPTPAPTDNKNAKPAVIQPTLIKGKVAKKPTKRVKRKKTLVNQGKGAVTAAPAPATAPAVPAAPATTSK
jgi:hypothetical protein